MFVAFVQGVIRPFYENFRPLDEGGGQKTGESADQDFLEEGRVHPNLESNESASNQGLYGNIDFPARDLRIFGAMTQQTQIKTPEIDPEKLTRALELELVQKRATWKQTSERARSVRAAGFVFLFFLVVGCLVGGYFAFMRMSEERQNRPSSASADH